MSHLLKQIPTYFLLKLFSKKSLVAKNLPAELKMQIPYPTHKCAQNTQSRDPQE